MLTRVVRKPASEAFKDRLPFWIACPDYPVPKHTKQALRDVTVNDGLHVQAVACLPPRNRLAASLDRHVAEDNGLYLRDRKPLARLHVEPMTHDPEKAVDYLLKNVARGRVTLDQIIILPRARSELK